MVARFTTGSHRRLRSSAALLAAAALCGCATLPAKQATAFQKMASASDAQFSDIIEREHDALAERAVRGVAGGLGALEIEGCNAVETGCSLQYTEEGTQVRMDRGAPQLRALVEAIGTYSGHMADLAEAKDIDDAQAQAGAAADSAAKLLEMIPTAGPVAGAALKLVVAGHRDRLVRERLRLMRQVAAYADPTIARVARRLDQVAAMTRENILLATSGSLRAVDRRLADGEPAAAPEPTGLRADRLRRLALRSAWARRELATMAAAPPPPVDQGALQDQRAAQAADKIRLYNAAAAAFALKPDFQPLADAHHTLLVSLENPKTSIAGALANIDKFVALVDAFAAAGKS